MARIWDQERTDTLKAKWLAGLPFSRIAAEMGIKRNAAVGKAHRMGLKRGRSVRQYTEEQRRERKNAAKRIKHREEAELRGVRFRPRIYLAATEQIAMSKTSEELRPAKLTPILDLKTKQCRQPYAWTADDPCPDGFSSVGYCGRKVAYDGCSYCGQHLLRNTNPKARQ